MEESTIKARLIIDTSGIGNKSTALKSATFTNFNPTLESLGDIGSAVSGLVLSSNLIYGVLSTISRYLRALPIDSRRTPRHFTLLYRGQRRQTPVYRAFHGNVD